MSRLRQTSTRRLVARLQRALGRTTTDSPVWSAMEPCAACGDETAAGSAFFSDRLTIVRPDSGSGFLCSACDASARAANKPWRPSGDEVEKLARNGSMAAGIFMGGGPGI
jgi:hypothetical protein